MYHGSKIYHATNMFLDNLKRNTLEITHCKIHVFSEFKKFAIQWRIS